MPKECIFTAGSLGQSISTDDYEYGTRFKWRIKLEEGRGEGVEFM
jgi:hypothetical protein